MEESRKFYVRDSWQADSYYQNGHKLLSIASDKGGVMKVIFLMTPSEEIAAYQKWREEKSVELGWED